MSFAGGEIPVHGIVLTAENIHEADRRLVILTAEIGKVTAFANYARREKSTLTAASQIFVMGDFVLIPGRSAYRLSRAVIRDAFPDLTKDILAMTYASYFNELTSYFTREGVRAADELNLLYVTYRALTAGKQDFTLIRSIFELKLLDVEGVGLQMGTCMICGRKDHLEGVSFSAGGAVCRDCLPGAGDAMKIRPGTVRALQEILSRPFSTLYGFDTSPEIRRELADVAEKWLGKHCDRQFKSLDILKSFM